jgi:BspA type Leucine rich repeat region (6 copies)
LNFKTGSNGVPRIDSFFSYCYSLTNIEIPDSVTSIGSFAGCSSLSNIVIPATVTNIDDNAFYSCGLISFIIPAGVPRIGEFAFAACTNLHSVLIPTVLPASGFMLSLAVQA